MGITTIKLPDDLKKRMAAVIKETGQSMHAFMVEAIWQQTEIAERRKSFVAEARRARRQMLRTGQGYLAEEVHIYMDALSRGGKVARPKARAWRK